MIIWAHRQRLLESQTHQAPAAAVPCCRGTAASHPHSTRRGQSPSARLRRTRPTLSKIDPPNRLPTPKPFHLQPISLPPCGVNPLPNGGQGRQRQQIERRCPIASLRFAPPSSTQKHLRPEQPAQRQKTATLRRAGCFGFGQQGSRRTGSVSTAVLIFCGMPSTPCQTYPCALLPVPVALRPPLHLSKRYAANGGQLPQMRDGVRPPSVLRPQLPPVGRLSAGGAASVGQSPKDKKPG